MSEKEITLYQEEIDDIRYFLIQYSDFLKSRDDVYSKHNITRIKIIVDKLESEMDETRTYDTSVQRLMDVFREPTTEDEDSFVKSLAIHAEIESTKDEPREEEGMVVDVPTFEEYCESLKRLKELNRKCDEEARK